MVGLMTLIGFSSTISFPVTTPSSQRAFHQRKVDSIGLAGEFTKLELYRFLVARRTVSVLHPFEMSLVFDTDIPQLGSRLGLLPLVIVGKRLSKRCDGTQPIGFSFLYPMSDVSRMDSRVVLRWNHGFWW